MEIAGIVEEMSMEEILKNEESPPGDYRQTGKIISVPIVGITGDAVLVDTGTKVEGIIPKSEFKEEYLSQLKVGDSIPVLLEKLHGSDGHPSVSYRMAVEVSAWKKCSQAFRDETPLECRVIKRVKGGFLVDIGIEAFVPGSQMEMRPVKRPDEWVGKTIHIMIIEMDQRKRNVVVSRRKIEEKKQKAVKEKFLAAHKVGDVIKGIVTGITKFGAFVDIGGVEGLLHVGNISWYRIRRVEDVLRKGDAIDVKLLSIEQNGDKISLGKKQLEPHPWDGIEDRFKPGAVVEGAVSSVTNFGAFVELEKGVEGLLHATEMSWKGKNVDPKKQVSVGKQINVKIISVDRTREKISLSLKRIEESPWEKAKKVYRPGCRVPGTVTHVTPFGAFVMLPIDVEGLLHVIDMSWIKRVKHPREMVSVGQQLDVVVLGVNVSDEKISLGIKQLTEDPYKKYRVKKVVEGKVKRLMDFGALIELEPGIDAFMHISEMLPRKGVDGNGRGKMRLGHPSEVLSGGDVIKAVVIKVQEAERKIDLSMRKYEKEMEKREIKKYLNADNRLTLGDLLGHEEDES